MLVRSVFKIFVVVLACIPCATGVWSQDFYSYRDSSGIRVLTNIPPSSMEGSEVQTTALKGATSNAPEPAPKIGDTPSAFDGLIRKYAGQYRVDPVLIHSIISTESNFDPKAVSTKGARGLMQLMPDTADRLGVKDSFDPEQNIRGGVQYFRSLLDIFDNDLELSLAAYNAGENLVRRLGKIPSYRETIDYVSSVTGKYQQKLKNSKDREALNLTRTFRYTDSTGVLHLTNIPPSR
jgi:soluble lytic murein transglycosylase-like protein